MNHYFKCIDSWHGASLEPRDFQVCSNEVVGVTNGHTLKGKFYIAKTFNNFGGEKQVSDTGPLGLLSQF